MTSSTADNSSSIDEARERYRIEREKRLRPEGMAQFNELKGDYADFDIDPYVEPGFAREAIVEETDAVIVGGGFAGMLTAINLTKQGVRNFRMVEKAGDFGGTWYWNRYPGCMCDVESYTYMPMLEETGYMPTEKYASAPEIFAYAQQLGRHFDLYPHALFQTEIDTAEWDEPAGRWLVTTTRGDKLSSKFFVTAGGILHKAKLPGIPGINDFAGRAFHTSRWDFSYTGGSSREPMENLRNKRVGIIGTGATAVQAVPRLAETAQELFVFQRTPSAVGVRNNGPTDVDWWNSLEPGWQAERIRNFTQAVTGTKPDRDLVDDGWTSVMWENTQRVPESPTEAELLEAADFATMESLRQRVDQIIDDPQTADNLKAWYGKHCKRVCFHDEYLPSFNAPNVHLVDTNGRGVEQITAAGVVVDGVEYELDLLIFASGFEVTTDLDQRLGFDPRGTQRCRAKRTLARRCTHFARRAVGRVSQHDDDQPGASRFWHQLLALPLEVGRTHCLAHRRMPKARHRHHRGDARGRGRVAQRVVQRGCRRRRVLGDLYARLLQQRAELQRQGPHGIWSMSAVFSTTPPISNAGETTARSPALAPPKSRGQAL